MKRLRLLLATLFVAFLSISLSAQQVTYIGIPSEKFNYVSATQKKSQWCWAATIQMILNYNGVNITQEQIVKRSYGSNPYNGELPDWPGSFETITSNLNNWNVDNKGKSYSVKAGMYWGAPSPTYLIEELKAQRPVLIAYNPTPYSGHAVIVTACSYVETPMGPYIQSLMVRDPAPDPYNVANKGRVEYAAGNLANVITAHWYVRVSHL